jgi:kynurenine formamidase
VTTWTDLSHAMSPEMFLQERYAGLRGVFCHTAYEEAGVNITAVELPVHAGTHVDSPSHFFPDRESIDQLTLPRFMGTAVVLDLATAAFGSIGVDRMRRAVESSGFQRGDIVLVATGWDKYFLSDPREYGRHPWLTVESAEYLARIGVKALGVDFATPDIPDPLRPAGFTWPVHLTLLGAGVLIYENLASITDLVGQRLDFLGLPIVARGADGGFCRAVARAHG